MSGVLLTKSSSFIIGPVSSLLGYLMSAIFYVLEKIGLPNIGLSIIIFTIVIYLCLLPLTIKQQKFSKLQAKMSPELKAIQKKYEGKRDNDSIMAMNEEQRAVYKKYGVSPSGSCIQLLIQLPILWALYRVIYNIPAYVPAVKEIFTDLVDGLFAKGEAATELFKGFQSAVNFTKQFESESYNFTENAEFVKNTFIDVLNKSSTSEWYAISDKFSDLTSVVDTTYKQFSELNNFLGLNIGNSPWYTIQNADGKIAIIIGACVIPVLAALFQFLSVKLMPQAPTQESTGSETADSMMQSMKMMNYTMPLMSAFFCFTLPAGVGLYWVAGSVFRCIQQVVINRYIDKIDFDEVIRKNQEKEAKKVKKDVAPNVLLQNANIRTKAEESTSKNSNTGLSKKEKEALIEAAKAKNAKAGSGSLASKVNMVSDYNNKSNAKNNDEN
ncbi:MAG: YidC/Oxa1 family membrane protein insertase [Lachnospiraceae bacterium]|nr:YidC/Oxa1 family membrane protein insertase [Lachnospiraceae bacterium]